MKKLINRPEAIVDEALEGLVAAHPGELRLAAPGTVVRADAPVAGKVGVISGGGAGHEPLHAGFVGPGMLDAACAGEVFTSPVPDRILAATRASDGGAGVLHIVKNYTGDVMNFELAGELAEAAGMLVRTVLVADDVAVEDSTWTAGRRGVGGTLFVEKIAGAAAEAGGSLDEVQALAAAFAWVWWRERKDAWLSRILALEVLCVLLFGQWYVARYYRIGVHLPIMVVLALSLVTTALILFGGWLWDGFRARRQARQGTGYNSTV